MSVCGKHSQVRALFCEQDLEVLVPLSSSPDHQGHHRRSRLVNSPLKLRERCVGVGGEREADGRAETESTLNFSTGSSLQNVSKRRLKGSGIHPPKYAAALVE